MKNTTNVFLEGLRMDLHPLSTSQLLLTDALNATMITYNGNEMMLQNDMGNTLILDSATGNIMGLSPGFVPIGMKEHGGIMYITSVDKEGNGEIGTIPSPIIRDFYKDKVIFEVNQSIPINVGDALKISNKLYPADKFIANLQMEINEADLIGQKFKKDSGLSPSPKDKSPADESPTDDPSDIVLGRDVIRYTAGLAEKQTLYTPVLSYNSNISEIQLQEYEDPISLFSSKGIYSLELYSRHDNSSDIPASFLSSPLTYQYNNKFVESNYWYLHTEFPTSVFPKDLLTATLNQDLKQFPSNGKPGYLAVKLLTEGINKFDILPRAKDPFFTPITYKSYQSSSKPQYYTYFPGFYYSTNSGIYIDRIEARVIDESTANEMPLVYPYDANSIPQFTIDTLENGSLFQGWKNSYLYPPKKLVGLFANTWYSDPDESVGHMYNPYKISNTLPQVQSISDENSFILTTLKSITDHNNTTMESSTKGENKTYGGVFCVPLGEKYNNWYRAEIDYYDLYNNKQGTFTKRFNPYLNDVFGTNLSVDGVEIGKSLVMGYKTSFTDKISLTQDVTVPFRCIAEISPYGRNINSDTWDPGDWTDWSTPYSTAELTVQFTSDNLNVDIDVSALLRIPTESYKKLHYLYTPQLWNNITWESLDKSTSISFNNLRLKLFFNGTNEFNSGDIILGGNINVNSAYIDYGGMPYCDAKNNGKGTMVMREFTFNDAKTTWLYLDGTLNKGADNGWIISASDSTKNITIDKELYILLDQDLTLNTNDSLTTETQKLSYTITQTTLSYNGIFGKLYGFGSITSVLEDNKLGGIEATRKKWAYTRLHKFGVVGDQNTNITLAYQYTHSLTPPYSITPYFCLTGTNDEGKQVYVQRFGNEDSTDIVYEHNFELGTDSNPRNYILEEGKPISSDLNQCSYTHSTPFQYYNTKLQYDLVLSPGIYVLNILRVPGNGTNNPESFLNLSVQVNSITKSFYKSLLLITPLYTDSITNTISSAERFETIYQPIVICLNTNSVVKITTDKGFERLSVGLYKIKDVNIDEMVKFYQIVDFYDSAMAYSNYMSNLAQTAESIYEGDKILQYAFIQKYGVFFKEAYVFIDGLIDENNIIRGVTIGDKKYCSYPFIPFDPSILPVSLSKYGDFIWNAYIMPESVLNATDNKYPNFVFSNQLDDEYTTEPGEGNLRQLIEQLN